MPFAENRGCRIHYEVQGDGPLVVLQHGFFQNQNDWKLFGYVDGLSNHFKVAAVDSLGHGQSDKPSETDRYLLAERAGDIVAVMDDLGADKAHLLGYSMGGWLSVGVAKHYPSRLRSLVVAGWDVVNGAPTALGAERIEFDAFLAMARELMAQEAPDLLDWVTPDVEAALAPCFEQLYDLEGSEQAVLNLQAPVMLWNGQQDPYHDPMLAFSRQHGIQYLSINGDHMGAIVNGAPEVLPTLQRFFARANEGS